MVFFSGIILLGVRGHPLAHALWVAASLVTLVLVCLWKGEPRRWRRGSD
jgi:hypothetical protein